MESGKNPVSTLKEMHDRRARVETTVSEPKYVDFVHLSGFKSLCMYSNLETEGIGKTKKEAKHNSALQMLIKLEESTPSNDNFGTSSVTSAPVREIDDQVSSGGLFTDSSEFLSSPKTEGKSSVSMLKELHDRRARVETTVSEPKYVDFVHSSGFKSLCMYSNLETEGIGKTKKEAKHNSALQMLIKLDESTPSNDNFGTSSVTSAPVREIDDQVSFGGLFSKSSKFLSSPETEEMAKAFMNKYSDVSRSTDGKRLFPRTEDVQVGYDDINFGMKSPDSPKSKILMDGLYKDMHPIDCFEEVIKELGVEFSSELLDVHADAGEVYLVMLKIDFHFLRVCGKGNTLGEAVENACRNGIDTLLLFME